MVKIRENPIKMDDLGVPPIFGNTLMYFCCYLKELSTSVDMTTQKIIKHLSTAAYNSHLSPEPLFLGLLLAPRPKSSNMAGQQGALQSTSLIYIERLHWKVTQSKVVSIIPDVELRICDIFLGSYIIYYNIKSILYFLVSF